MQPGPKHKGFFTRTLSKIRNTKKVQEDPMALREQLHYISRYV